MRRANLAQKVLVLFTSRQRAEAFVGDFLEDEGAGRISSLWLYLVPTIARLFWTDVILLSHKSVLFFFTVLVGQVATMSVSPFLNPLPGWKPTTHELEWCVALAILGEILLPLFVGFVVSGLSREHESTVCMAMAVVVEIVLLVYWTAANGIAEPAIPLTRFLLMNSAVPIMLATAGVLVRKKRLRTIF